MTEATPSTPAVPEALPWAGREEEFHNYWLHEEYSEHDDAPPCPGCGAQWKRLAPHPNGHRPGWVKQHSSSCAYLGWLSEPEQDELV